MVVCFIQIYSTLGIGAARDMTGNGQFNSIWFNSRQIDSRINIKHPNICFFIFLPAGSSFASLPISEKHFFFFLKRLNDILAKRINKTTLISPGETLLQIKSKHWDLSLNFVYSNTNTHRGRPRLSVLFRGEYLIPSYFFKMVSGHL